MTTGSIARLAATAVLFMLGGQSAAQTNTAPVMRTPAERHAANLDAMRETRVRMNRHGRPRTVPQPANAAPAGGLVIVPADGRAPIENADVRAAAVRLDRARNSADAAIQSLPASTSWQDQSRLGDLQEELSRARTPAQARQVEIEAAREEHRRTEQELFGR